MKIKQFIRNVIAITLLLSSSMASAGFPDDFSDVIWIDPDISSFPVTAAVSVNVRGSILDVQDSMRSVWPRRFHTILRNDCCNRSLWIFVKLEGQWYASTFEFIRFGETRRFVASVNGMQIQRPPFLRSGFEWRPAAGEVYGFMTSGMSRFNFDNLNVRERSNVSLYRWEVGPTNNIDFDEVPRGPDGRPVADGAPTAPSVPEEPEVCVEPAAPPAVNNTHTYNGSATGNLVITGAINENVDYTENNLSITVEDDRSLKFDIGRQSFSTQVAANGSFTGTFTFNILGQCDVDIIVNGSIDGTSSTGTASGRDSCVGNTATLNATYSATSATAPSFLDQRSTPRVPRTCPRDVSLSPIISLLLD